jgi:hypothetical protein
MVKVPGSPFSNLSREIEEWEAEDKPLENWNVRKKKKAFVSKRALGIVLKSYLMRISSNSGWLVFALCQISLC